MWSCASGNVIDSSLNQLERGEMRESLLGFRLVQMLESSPVTECLDKHAIGINLAALEAGPEAFEQHPDEPLLGLPLATGLLEMPEFVGELINELLVDLMPQPCDRAEHLIEGIDTISVRINPWDLGPRFHASYPFSNATHPGAAMGEEAASAAAICLTRPTRASLPFPYQQGPAPLCTLYTGLGDLTSRSFLADRGAGRVESIVPLCCRVNRTVIPTEISTMPSSDRKPPWPLAYRSPEGFLSQPVPIHHPGKRLGEYR